MSRDAPPPEGKRCRLPAPASGVVSALLDLDDGALVLELLLELGCLVLGDALLDRLAAGFHQVLGLLQAEPGDSTHLLDDVDLLLASGFEDDGEFGLLL